MKYSVYILLVLGVLACKKNKTTFDLGYDYVPLDSGLTLVYQVRDIFHDEVLVPAHDTQYYQVKTVIGESFQDDLGDTTYKLRRYIRESDIEDWQIKDVWTIKNTGKRIEIVEENKRLIDFVFAPDLTEKWDANALNDLPEKMSQFVSVHSDHHVGTYHFDSSCTVEHQNFISFVDYNLEKDVFAKGLGKVYSIVKELKIDNFDTLDIKKGTEIEYQLIDYSF